MTAAAPRLAFVALGSNLGDRASHLEQALASLRDTTGVCTLSRSPWFETTPVGGATLPFLNGVVRLTTTLGPEQLLTCCLAIETALGRTRQPNICDRTVDLDVLLMFEGGASIDRSQAPALPHPRMIQRDFVLAPLLAFSADLPVAYATELRAALDALPAHARTLLC